MYVVSVVCPSSAIICASVKRLAAGLLSDVLQCTHLSTSIDTTRQTRPPCLSLSGHCTRHVTDILCQQCTVAADDEVWRGCGYLGSADTVIKDLSSCRIKWSSLSFCCFRLCWESFGHSTVIFTLATVCQEWEVPKKQYFNTSSNAGQCSCSVTASKRCIVIDYKHHWVVWVLYSRSTQKMPEALSADCFCLIRPVHQVCKVLSYSDLYFQLPSRKINWLIR